MARTTIRHAAPAPASYHLAVDLQARAIDSLYRFTPGQHSLDSIAGQTITAVITEHAWGYSATLHAITSDGHLAAAAEASAATPLPASIHSRITTYQAGSLTWTNTAEALTAAGIEISKPLTFEAAGRHSYQLRRIIDPDTYRQTWSLRVDDQQCPHLFAGPVGAAEFIHSEHERR